MQAAGPDSAVVAGETVRLRFSVKGYDALDSWDVYWTGRQVRSLPACCTLCLCCQHNDCMVPVTQYTSRLASNMTINNPAICPQIIATLVSHLQRSTCHAASISKHFLLDMVHGMLPASKQGFSLLAAEL